MGYSVIIVVLYVCNNFVRPSCGELRILVREKATWACQIPVAMLTAN